MDTIKEKECCPVFRPAKWSEKSFKWKDKAFIKTWIPLFFHIPIRSMVAKKIIKLLGKAEYANALAERKEDILLLFTHPNPFKSEIYLSVKQPVRAAKNAPLSGNFISKVFDGPHKAIPKFMRQMEDYLRLQEEKAKRFFVHYAYCPKCVEKYGHNYIVIFAELNDNNQSQTK